MPSTLNAQPLEILRKIGELVRGPLKLLDSYYWD